MDKQWAGLLRNTPVEHTHRATVLPSPASCLTCSSINTSCTPAHHLSSFRFDCFFHSEGHRLKLLETTQAFSRLSTFPVSCMVTCLAERSATAASVLRKRWEVSVEFQGKSREANHKQQYYTWTIYPEDSALPVTENKSLKELVCKTIIL